MPFQMITRWPTIKRLAALNPTQQLLAATLVLGFSLALRCYALSRSSYWNDEMISLGYAIAPTWSSVLWDNSPPFYHSLLKLWVSLFGTTETATRMLSVLFSVGATAVVMKIGHELRGLYGMLCAGILHAVSCLSINYAQETRMYSLFELCTAINLLYFLRLYLGVGRQNVKRYVASILLLVFANYLAVVPLLAEELLFLVRDLRSQKKNPMALKIHSGLALGLAVIGASCLWWVNWTALGWQKAKFEIEATSHFPVLLLSKLCSFSWIFAAVFSGLVIASGFRSKGRRERLTLATMVLLPIALMTVGGFVLQRGLLLERYLISVLPPFVLWVCLTLTDMAGSAKLRWAAVAVLFAAILWGLPRAYVPYKENWREAAEIVHRNPGLVLTMHKPAVRTPYFAQYEIPLRQWDPRDEGAEETLRREVLSRQRVWLVDSYTNARFYPSIHEWTVNLGLRDTSITVPTGSYTSLNLMLIEDPNP